MLTLAQQIPDTAWWQSWGIAGIVVMLLIAGIAYWYYEITVPHVRAKQKMERDHLAARQRMELEREGKHLKLLDTVTEVQVEQQGILKRMVAVQERHATTCEETHRLVERLAKERAVQRCQDDDCDLPGGRLFERGYFDGRIWRCVECHERRQRRAMQSDEPKPLGQHYSEQTRPPQ